MNILIIGCGNILKGDDGFGPKVIEYLEENFQPSESVQIIDAGLSCGEWLRPMIIDDERPDWVIIIDTMDLNEQPGKIKVIKADEIPRIPQQISSHFFPDRKIIDPLLKTGMRMTFIACQFKQIPDGLTTELSAEVKNAIPSAARIIAELTGLGRKMH